MRLKEYREYKKQCEKQGVKVKAEVYRLIYFRLIDLYGFDLVLSHVDWIKKILSR